MAVQSKGAGPAINWAGLVHLMVVYVGWSGTYVAIRFAVRPGSGFPPLSVVGLRLFVAGLVLTAWVALTGKALRLSGRDLGVVLGAAVLLWGGGNGLVTWAEQYASAGYAALLIGSTPIWVAIMEAVIDRRRPSARFMLSLAVGFAGVAILAAPVIAAGGRAEVAALAALALAPISWGAGSLLQVRKPIASGPLVSSAYQHLMGALLFGGAALMAAEPLPSPTAEAWWGWGYLVVFGSIVTFTSFIRALQLLPTSIVMTYSYVNPVGAVFLGWLLLGEPVTLWTLGGAVLVLAGVAGVFHERQQSVK